MEREYYEVAPRRSRVLAASVLMAALVTGTLVVMRGLDHHSVVSLPPVLGRGISPELPAGLDLRTLQGGKLLAGLARAGRAGSSVVEVQAGTRHGTGFVAWTDARHSYVLTAWPVVGRLLRAGRRDVQIMAGGEQYPGRLLAASAASQLALVRTRGRIARGLLMIRPGMPEPGRTALTVSLPRGHRRVQELELRLTPAANLRGLAQRRIALGSPVLLLNGHVGGIVVRGGRDAVVLPLAHCHDRVRCFGPRLP